MANQYVIPRRLPDRANLTFNFPNPIGGPPIVVGLPFFENPKIRERKKARYQKYSLISRSSNLYSYLGADSRQLDLTFHMTLPHFMEEHSMHEGMSRDDYFNVFTSDENPDNQKARFLSPVTTADRVENPSVRIALNFTRLPGLEDSAKQVLHANQGISSAQKDYIIRTYLIDQQDALQEAHDAAQSAQTVASFSADPADQKNAEKAAESLNFRQDKAEGILQVTKYVDLIIYWVNIIRSSVVNNAANPLNGPPIIRLRHGVMYQDIPCICHDYTIEWEETGGYDLKTLLPRRLKISMKLEELRSGDFGEFNRDTASPITRDNLAGWEAVINTPGSMDPGYIYSQPSNPTP